MTIYSFVHSSNINRKIDDDRTALMHAASHGQFYIVKFLIEQSVDTMQLDKNRETAADIAARNGHDAVAAFIDVYNNDDWQRITQIEKLLTELRSDGLDQFRLPKYKGISSSMIELPKSLGDYSWFRVTDRVTIGIHNTDGMVFLTWLIDGHRVDDV